MRLQCFSAEFVAWLKSQASANLSQYGEDNQWIQEAAAGRGHTRETGIEVDSLPDLLQPVGSDLADAENARRIHTSLRKLTPLQAMDERLWACLTHVRYWDYMKARWHPDSAGALRDRYLFSGTGFGTLVRNGIARLWWFGHVTWDSGRGDPYEMTDILLCNQDVQQALLQRSFGKSRRVLHCILEHIKINRDTVYADGIGTKIKAKAKLLNVLGGVALLDAMPRRAIHEFLSEDS